MATTWPLLLPLLLTFVTTFHFAAASPEASPWPKNYISYDIYKQSVEIFNEAVKQQYSNPTGAKQLYLQATAVNPYLAEGWLNLGMLGQNNAEIEQFYSRAAEAASEGRNDAVYVVEKNINKLTTI